jgi:hypothetical protein
MTWDLAANHLGGIGADSLHVTISTILSLVIEKRTKISIKPDKIRYQELQLLTSFGDKYIVLKTKPIEGYTFLVKTARHIETEIKVIELNKLIYKQKLDITMFKKFDR